jgi:hypothetical protein
MNSVVYFVSDGVASIKIGYSADLKSRLSQLGSASARPLMLIGCVEGDRSQERQLHAALNDYRSSGEWFSDCPTVRAMIGRVMEVGLVAAGFEPQVGASAELETLAEARRLGEIILRCSGASLRECPDEICGVPRAVLWRLRYRPGKDVYADELTLLRQAALKATEIALRRAEEDRRFAVEISERCAADILRFEHGEQELRRLEALVGGPRRTGND